MTREQATAELRNFIESHAGPDDVDAMIRAIESSIRRFATRLQRLKVRDQAQELAEAAEAYVSAGKRYRAALGLSAPIIPDLLMNAPADEGAGVKQASQRLLEALRAGVSDDQLLQARKVKAAAAATVMRFSAHKREPDDLRVALGYELVKSFEAITGDSATFSNSGDFDQPGTPFGRFVRLAIIASEDSTAPPVQDLMKRFASFIFDAVTKHRNLASPFGEEFEKKS